MVHASWVFLPKCRLWSFYTGLAPLCACRAATRPFTHTEKNLSVPASCLCTGMSTCATMFSAICSMLLPTYVCYMALHLHDRVWHMFCAVPVKTRKPCALSPAVPAETCTTCALSHAVPAETRTPCALSPAYIKAFLARTNAKP
jgi:hypothetical protein